MDLTGAIWRTSTRSDNGGSTCVEVAKNLPEAVGVRDSKDRRGPVLAFPPGAWAAFTRAVAHDRLTPWRPIGECSRGRALTMLPGSPVRAEGAPG